ncbi:MAG: C40 family peptidase [Bacteroidales bacterium]
MERGICLLSVAAMRREPSHRSELVNQLVFGDPFEILEHHQEWCLIRMAFDGYQGWINLNQMSPLDQVEWQAIQSQTTKTVSTDLIQVLEDKTRDTRFAVGPGCSFPFFDQGRFSLSGKVYEYPGEVFTSKYPAYDQVGRHAMIFLNTPYLWGGRSPMGIDCSGLTQLAYKMAGITIARDASLQAQHGQTIHLINEAQPGDLLFFDNEEQQITHVGILINEGHIIHAHGKVRIDLIDHHGIYNLDLRKYTHQLRIIKRIHAETHQFLR